MEKSPLISVVIPVFNGEEHLEATLHSVLGQELTSFDLEVIVFNNGSTDDTAKILHSVEDERVKIYHSKETISGPANWNRVSRLAQGDYIKLLPADDLLLSNCLQVQAEILAKDASLALVTSPRIVTSHGGRDLPKPLWSLPPIGKRNREQILNTVLKKSANILGETACVMFRRSAFVNSLPWKDNLPYVIDLDFYLRALEFGNYFGTNLPLAKFRLSPNSWSASFVDKQSQHLISLLEDLGAQTETNYSNLILMFRRVRVKGRSIARRAVNFLYRKN